MLLIASDCFVIASYCFGQVCPLPEEAPLEPLVEDTAILERGVRLHSTSAADFLDHDRNARQFGGGAK